MLLWPKIINYIDFHQILYEIFSYINKYVTKSIKTTELCSPVALYCDDVW